MYWTVEMKKSGCFQGSKLKKVLREMIEYCVEECNSPTITEITATYENGDEKVMCEKGVTKIQKFLDEQIEEVL